MPLPNLPIKTGQMFMGAAIIMGLLTVGVFTSDQKKEKKPKTMKIETQSVVVPMVPVKEGQTLSTDDVTAVQWPKAYLPKGSTFADTYQVIGRIAKQDMYPGEPVYKEKVSGSDTNGGLPAIIPEGMRAVTVDVNEVKGVAGFVKPGDRVDVLTTFDVNDHESGETVRITRTVLQNALVLASAQTMVDDSRVNMETPEGVTRGSVQPVEEEKTDKKKDKDKDKDKKKEKSDADAQKERKAREKEKAAAEKKARLTSSVTLALLPVEAQRMALAEETGQIRLVLRPENDHVVSEVPGVDLNELLGRIAPARKPKRDGGTMPTAAAPPPSFSMPPVPRNSIEVIQGTEKTSVEY
jgi:pilus assembly protein CpaB